jgi:hypothetical protein
MGCLVFLRLYRGFSLVGSWCEIGSQVLASVRQMEAELNAGALLTVEPTRMRVRLLPLLSRR